MKERNKMAVSKGFSVLPIFVGVIIAFVSVIVIVAAAVIFVISVISLKIFGAGGIEVIGAVNSPYVIANALSNSQVDGRPLLEPILAASVTRVDAATMSKVSGEIKRLLENYDFPYVVRLEGASVSAASCTRQYENKHKAVDISAICGTPVKAICGGRLSKIGPGLSGDPVFGGTINGGQEGLQIQHDDRCNWQGYSSFYGCIEIPDSARNVKKGEIIGYVSTCKSEPGDCHLHFVVTKGPIRDAEDPKICNDLGPLLDQDASILARKGEIDPDALTTEASIPLLFKDSKRKLVVIVGER